MRSDMSKVIVERPRRGAGWSRKGRTLRADDLELCESDLKAEARQRAQTKNLNENLAPLRRYLDRQVGRPWDEVWSEICANLKATSTVQQHVRDHVPDFVAIKTSLRHGAIEVHERYSPTLLARAHVRLYVDPVDGILKRNERFNSWRRTWRSEQKAREAALADRMRVVTRKKQLHRFGNCWWEVTLKEGTPPILRSAMRSETRLAWIVEVDVVHRAKLSALPRAELYGRDGVFAIAKRQLSKKEMRDLGLPRPH